MTTPAWANHRVPRDDPKAREALVDPLVRAAKAALDVVDSPELDEPVELLALVAGQDVEAGWRRAGYPHVVDKTHGLGAAAAVIGQLSGLVVAFDTYSRLAALPDLSRQ